MNPALRSLRLLLRDRNLVLWLAFISLAAVLVLLALL
jgi:hypothetical protein